MKRFTIKIKFKIGEFKFETKNSFQPKGICKNCKQDIFWIKILGKAKIQATKIGENEYIDHSLCCPTVLAYENRKKKSKFKKYKK